MPKNKTFKRIGKIPPKTVDVTFDVDGGLKQYKSFIDKLCEELGNHNDPESRFYFQESIWPTRAKKKESIWRKPHHILLPKQTAAEPARWIVIKLSTNDHKHKTTLFVRDDNVYLVGFENQKGQKYQSSRAPKKNEKTPDQILEDAIPLGYDLSYDDLGGDSSRWDLKRISINEAVIKLATYGTEENSNKKQECVKKYLARLIVFICEAARMYRILTRVQEGCFANGGSVLTAIERETLNEWVHISQAMMKWGSYTPGLKKIEVENDEQAGDVVRLIKYARTGIKANKSPGGDDPSDAPPGDGNGHGTSPGDCNGHGTSPGDGNGHGTPPGGGSGDGTSPGGGNGHPPPADRNGKNLQHAPEGNDKSQQRRQQQGRSLVEMFSIHLTEGCTLPGVSSITVFDGKRGQIIYWNEEDGDAPRVDSKGDLVLTGPYRAISAGGRVALRITSVSDSDATEDDLLIWDPYTKDAHEEINELISGDIAKDLTLTYAVLSSAVEAAVQVDVFLAKETDFYGEITARSKLINGEEVSVVLFSREIKGKLELKSSSAGSTIPLTRSVLAWRVGSPLLIEVDSFHSISLSCHGLHLRTKVERSFERLEFSFDDHSDKVGFATLKDFGYIRVSVDDTGKYREKTNNSLPRSLMNQMSPDVSTEARHDTELTLAAERNADLRRSGIRERRLRAKDSMDLEDIRTDPKLLVVRTSHHLHRLINYRFITCLLHLTNDSDDQHVAFRCREDRRFLRSLLAHSSARKWELSGIVPPNSTSTYLLIAYWPHSLILESCAVWQDEKHVDTIFPASSEGIEKVTQSVTVGETADETTTSEQADDDVGLDSIFGAAKERTEKVTLTVRDRRDKTITSEWAKDDEDTFFSRPSKGIKEVTIKGTLSHPADVPMTSETEIKIPIPESSINQSDLDVYPLQLHFPFKQDKVICCPLRLTNRTDYYVIFKCLPHTPYSNLYTLDHLNGILLPRSTCTYVVAMQKQMDLPDNMDALSVILKSCTAEKITGPFEYISSQDPMDGVTPNAICDKAPIPPRIEIITVTRKGYEILSMDVHPTEPWILASHFNGNVSIWNYQTEARVMELRVSDSRPRGFGRRIFSAKFIAAEKWIVAGTGGGLIYVVKYTTNTEVSKFKAHRESVNSLAVHPNKPFVLSASSDWTIMLWNWDVNRDPIWKNTRTFRGHSRVVNHVMFNPYDNGNTFASASDDFTVKIWSTNDPNDEPKPIASLECGEVRPRHVAYYSMSGRQYMITGSLKQGAARVWDLEKPNKPIKELDGLAKEEYPYGCNVGVLNCGPDDINPVLITVSGDKGISFLDATTYKPRYDKVNFGLGVAMGFAVIDVKGKRSLAIALREGIAIMEMNEDQVNSPATVEQAQEGIYSAESSNDQ